MTRNAANGKKEAEVRLGAFTKRNESEVELAASQSCSQSAAEPLHQAKTAEGLTSRSRMTRTHLAVNAQIRYVTMQMKCGVTHTGSGEMGASPGTQRSLRAG